MDLKGYNQKYVRVQTIYGDTLTGLARYETRDYLASEWGGEEDGLFIEDFIVFNSQIGSIEEITIHGTAELWTQQLILRRYCPEDAQPLHRYLGTDPEMSRYSGWNPYATPEMARETVQELIARYHDGQFYSWVMDIEGVVVGTIGAYDRKERQIEVGFSVVRGWQGRGLATEALKKVLEYLTENEGFSRVTAWCAAENTGSRRVLEKAGMRCVQTVPGGLTVGEKTYDKLIYEYRWDPEAIAGAPSD